MTSITLTNRKKEYLMLPIDNDLFTHVYTNANV